MLKKNNCRPRLQEELGGCCLRVLGRGCGVSEQVWQCELWEGIRSSGELDVIWCGGAHSSSCWIGCWIWRKREGVRDDLRAGLENLEDRVSFNWDGEGLCDGQSGVGAIADTLPRRKCRQSRGTWRIWFQITMTLKFEERREISKEDWKRMPSYKRELRKQWEGVRDCGIIETSAATVCHRPASLGEETWRQRFPRRWCVGLGHLSVVREAGLGRGRREESNVIKRKASATLDRNSGAEGGHSDIILNWNKALVAWHRLVTGWSPHKIVHAIP